MELMLRPLRKYAKFNGRARRAEFWLFWLFNLVVGGLADRLDGGRAFGVLSVITMAVLLVPNLALQVRRLHDIDRSGFWVLLWLIPLLGWVVLFVFNLLPGTQGTNRFGPDPKEGPGDVAAAFS